MNDIEQLNELTRQIVSMGYESLPNTAVMSSNAIAAIEVLAGKRCGRRRSRQVRGTRARNYERARERARRALR